MVYVKHPSQQNPTKNLYKDDVVLFKEIFRKITQSIEIVCQIYHKNKNDSNLQVIGRIDRHNYEYTESPYKNTHIYDIPNTAILRNRIYLDVTISRINMIRIKYICETCNSDKCNDKCNIKLPKS